MAQLERREKVLKGLVPGLEQIRRKHAPNIAKASRKLMEAAKELQLFEEKMDDECKELAGGEDYDTVFTATFQPHGGNMESQMDSLGDIQGPGVDDVVEMAEEMARAAEEECDAE